LSGDVTRWYAAKTAGVVEKYGPGPRIHFHSGLVDAPVAEGAPLAALRAALVDSQERLVRECADAWDAKRRLAGRVLDVGCGLGGGAIFLAQEYGARVVAATNVSLHARLVRGFAEQAGVAAQIETRVADACELADPEPFDAVVAIESSCYFDRSRWFARLARLLRGDGRVHVVDCLANDARAASAFDRYFLCRLGTRAEYEAAAAAAGFALAETFVLNERAAAFWELSIAWSRARAAEGGEPGRDLAASIAAHATFRDAYRGRGVDLARLTFVRRGAGSRSRISR
jgi:tocopherol O-methyltransferase